MILLLGSKLIKHKFVEFDIQTIAFFANSTAFRTAAPPEALLGKREAPVKEGEEIVVFTCHFNDHVMIMSYI